MAKKKNMTRIPEQIRAITAKNYAAQAAEAIIRNSADMTTDEIIRLKSQVNFIKEAVKFAMPDGGFIFDDDLSGIRGQHAQLPFDKITVEYACFFEGQLIKTLVLCEKNGDNIDISSFYGVKDVWEPCPVGMQIMCDWWDYSDVTLPSINNRVQREDKFRLKCRVFPLYRSGYPSLEDDISKGNAHGITNDAKALLEFLEALTCRNVSMSNYQDAFKDNDKRIKEGKLPFYETKMLVIDTQYTAGSKTVNGGSHASPRQHLRRGHIRRHATAGNIWIQSSVVGDPTKGSISKSYQVK